MTIVVNAPRVRSEIRRCRLHRAQGQTKANIQTKIEGTTDWDGTAKVPVFLRNPKAADRTLILAEVAA